MKDVRKLVPRTPPEGLLEWAAERHKELDQDGLLIETEWAQDWSLEVMLDEWAENRKVRAIRATCSACKESGLLWRGRDGRGEWGFIHPGTWTEGEGGEVCADGDKTTCPWCGESVIVRRKADVRKKGWFVAAERHVMSASVLGKDRLLTLTGWTVQRRITAAAGRQLVAIPAEAYVFSAEDCAQLMGWVNSYSGTTGYSIQYTRSWRQPKDWVERWGSERGIFGLTPELVADSCLPHCKLDRYMAEPRRHAARYPVAWLRLCQKHPNAESLLVHGLPDVLDELIAEQKFDALEAKVGGLQSQLTEANGKLEGYDPEWKAKAKQMQQEADQKVEAVRFDYALKAALTAAKAKNPELVAKSINRDALKLTDAGLVGLEEQLKALKESDGYLFEGDKPAPEIVKPGSPIRRTPAGGGDLDAFYANNPFYKKKA